MKKRILSIVTALALTLALLPAAVVQAGAVTVSSSEQFHAALASAKDGDTIQVSGSFIVKNSVSNNDSLVIDKAVTIRGGTLTFWYAGILLGADVTFQNITLGLASNARNAIMANGHKLTLDNVKKASGTRDIHLFCGGLTGGAGTQGELAAEKQGGSGQIIIRGGTDLGAANIYAGSISTDGGPNVFTGDASVTVESMASGASIGHIYASGALETHTSENDWFDIDNEIAPPTPITDQFPVTGDVAISLRGTAVKAVDGDTGSGSCAAVTYDDGGSGYLNDGLVLENIASLNVRSGNLTPALGSFLFPDTPLAVAGGAILGLQNLGAVSAGDFTGGGSLILGEGQQLEVTGAVSGKTTVAIGDLLGGGENVHSQVVPAVGAAYITAPSSGVDSFVLATPASRPDMTLVRGENGMWTVAAGEDIVIVSEFRLDSLEVGPDAEGAPLLDFKYVEPEDANLPFRAMFTAVDEEGYLDPKLTITVNGVATTPIYDGYDDGNYVFSTENRLRDEIWLDVVGGETTDEALQVSGTFYAVPPAGVYNIEVTVPAENSATGQPITRMGTLTVLAAEGQKTPVPVPKANEELVYNGAVQAGVPEGPGYELSGDASAMDAGNYTAVVNWMIDRGLTGGYGDGSFGTNDVVSREQLVTFLYRYANSMGYSTAGDADLSGFADGDSVSSYAAEAMRWAVGSGLIVGGDGGALDPRGSATRAQVAAILKRFVVNLTR